MGISFVSHFVLSFNLINMDLLLGSNVLSDEDHDNIRAFKLRMVSNMPRMAFEQMRFTFKHKLNIHSLYVIHQENVRVIFEVFVFGNHIFEVFIFVNHIFGDYVFVNEVF